MQLLPEKIHRKIYLFAILLLAISIPLSKFGMSVSVLLLTGNWLLEGDLKRKFSCFFQNKAALVLASIFIIHVLWLFNTANFSYSLDDLRTKIPILALAIIFSTTPLITVRQFKTLIFSHIGAVLLATIAGFYIYVTRNIAEIREISPFISHIRLSLNLCLAILSLLYFIVNDKNLNKYLRIGLLLLSIWLFLFLFILQSITGIIILAVCFFVLLIYYIYKNTKSKYHRIILISIFLFIPFLGIWPTYLMVYNYFTPQISDTQNLEDTTFYGNPYLHDTLGMPVENGKYIGLYINYQELKTAWEERSQLPFDQYDEKGQDTRTTLIRYLNSKNLRKDYKGVWQLSDQDIKNVEKGIANYRFTQFFNPKIRIYKILWEFQNYQKYGNIQGHSLIQRFELWSAAISIIQKNWVLGTGTGDIPDVFKQELTERNSPLKDTRMRSHNQFLSFFIAFGIFGFLWFLFALFYPILTQIKRNDYFFVLFLIIVFMSMLTEDTLESQDGLTFFAYFYALFLFQRPQNLTSYDK